MYGFACDWYENPSAVIVRWNFNQYTSIAYFDLSPVCSNVFESLDRMSMYSAQPEFHTFASAFSTYLATLMVTHNALYRKMRCSTPEMCLVTMNARRKARRVIVIVKSFQVAAHRYRAASKIVKRIEKAWCDPVTDLCRNRLLREYKQLTE